MVRGGKRPGAGRKTSGTGKKQINKRVSEEARDHLAILAEKYTNNNETEALERCILQTKTIIINE